MEFIVINNGKKLCLFFISEENKRVALQYRYPHDFQYGNMVKDMGLAWVFV
jgi:hypothetical protein